MRHFLAFALLLTSVILVPAGPAPAEEGPPSTSREAPPILPLSEVRPGMKGHAETIFEGTKIERFGVEILDVIKNYLPKQDVILVRCFGEKVEHTGIAQGMSGSPVYVDGRLVGSLSYTWAWAKDPLGGVTPIEEMLAQGERPLEGRASGAAPRTPLRRRPPVPIADGLADAHGADPRALRPIGTPLAAGGFSADGRRRIAENLTPHGFSLKPVGGGLVTGAPQGWANLDAPLVPGAALVVDLVRGDLSLSASGTCTYVKDGKVYGFGHDFQGMGETLFPLSVGYVYRVIPSRNISFKLGASIREVGALVQDRPSGILGHLDQRAPMIPFDVTIRNAATKREESLHFEITANRVFFNQMMIVCLRESFSRAETTLGWNSKRYRIEVKLKGVERPWAYDDMIASFDMGLQRQLIGLVERVENHPQQRAEYEWVKLHVDIENSDRRARIESVTASRDDARPGDEIELLVRLKKQDGGAIFYERMKMKVPASVPPGNFQIAVLGGDNVPAEVPTPVDIADIPTLYEGFYKSTELVLVHPTGRVSLDMDGRLVKDVPLSAIPRLVRSTNGIRPRIQPVLGKIRRDVPYIVAGQGGVTVRIHE